MITMSRGGGTKITFVALSTVASVSATVASCPSVGHTPGVNELPVSSSPSFSSFLLSPSLPWSFSCFLLYQHRGDLQWFPISLWYGMRRAGHGFLIYWVLLGGGGGREAPTCLSFLWCRGRAKRADGVGKEYGWLLLFMMQSEIRVGSNFLPQCSMGGGGRTKVLSYSLCGDMWWSHSPPRVSKFLI